MAFFAILRDSYREAVSGWVLQVMLVLSLLTMLLIASISFEPISLERELEKHFAIPNFLLGFDPQYKGTEYRVENLKSSNPDQPWKSDYQFDVILSAPDAETLKRAQSAGLPSSPGLMRLFIQERLDFFKKLEVTEENALPAAAVAGGHVAAPKSSELRFHVSASESKISDRLAWFHQPAIFFGLIEVPGSYTLREGIYTLEKRLVNDGGGWLTLLVGVVITAGFIPNMLQKGTLDLYISKPISRPALLIYKYLGGLTFVLVLTTFTVTGVWIVIGLRTGIWSLQFLALIPILTFYFAVLYAVSTFVAVYTRSTILAILATVIAWGLFLAAGLLTDRVEQAKRAEAEAVAKIREMQKLKDEGEPVPDELLPTKALLPNWLQTLARVSHAIFPRTYDLDDRMIQLIAEGVLTDVELKREGRDQPLPSWGETVGVSLLFIALFLTLACWRFSTRDG